jgi:hypothetical protein
VKCITDALNNIKNKSSEGPQKNDLNINNDDDNIVNNVNGNDLEKKELATLTDINFHGYEEIFYYEVCGKIFCHLKFFLFLMLTKINEHNIETMFCFVA